MKPAPIPRPACCASATASGELRAIGDVLTDQLAAMARCGFDAFLLRADQSPAAALAALAAGPHPPGRIGPDADA